MQFLKSQIRGKNFKHIQWSLGMHGGLGAGPPHPTDSKTCRCSDRSFQKCQLKKMLKDKSSYKITVQKQTKKLKTLLCPTIITTTIPTCPPKSSLFKSKYSYLAVIQAAIYPSDYFLYK